MAKSARERLVQYIRGHQLAAIIHVAAKLDLAEHIGSGCRIDVLAQRVGAQASALERVLRALAAHDIFAIHAGAWVGPTEMSEHLRPGCAASLHPAAAFFAAPMNWRCWEGLGQAVRSGQQVFDSVHGRAMFQYLEDRPDESARFHEFMSHGPDDRQRAVVDAYDFSQATHIVDVGGGAGELLIAIMRRHSAPCGTLYDRESVRGDALKNLAAIGLGERCRFVAGDFFESIPAGGDLYLLSQILHDWGDQDCLRILRRCRDVMPPGAKLLLVERLVDRDGRAHSANNYLSDIEMMLVLGSRERTQTEYIEIVLDSGFQNPQIFNTLSSFSLIEAKAC